VSWRNSPPSVEEVVALFAKGGRGHEAGGSPRAGNAGNDGGREARPSGRRRQGRASVGARRFVMGDRMASLQAVKRRMVLRISGGFSSSVQ
jgi:hypothetical protein